MPTTRMQAVAGSMALLAGALAAGPAAAHHVMDNQLPATFMQGLLSGLGHPVIGLDHLAAVVAVGLLASLHRRGGLLAVVFVLAGLAGAALHVRGWTVPHGEILVALTVIGLGVLLASGGVATGALLAAFSVAGFLHGYVMGESIVGAEPTPLVAYFAGLAVVQMGLALAVVLAARTLTLPAGGLRLAGAAVALLGAVFVALAAAA